MQRPATTLVTIAMTGNFVSLKTPQHTGGEDDIVVAMVMMLPLMVPIKSCRQANSPLRRQSCNDGTHKYRSHHRPGPSACNMYILHDVHTSW